MIQAPTLTDLPGVQHRFFTREGGVSAGLFSSLNCGYGSADNPENVRENRRRAAPEVGLGGPDLLTVHQIHSTAPLPRGAGRWTSPAPAPAPPLLPTPPRAPPAVPAPPCS